MHLLSFTAVKPIKIQIMSPPPLIFRPSYGPVKQSQVEDGKLQQVVFWSWPNKTVASNAWAIPQKLEFSVNPITYLFSGWSFLMIIALYRLFLPSKTQFGQKDIALPEKSSVNSKNLRLLLLKLKEIAGWNLKINSAFNLEVIFSGLDLTWNGVQMVF